jgi:hypothetical protein
VICAISALQAFQQQPGSATYAAGSGGYGYGRGAYEGFPVGYGARSTQSASLYIKNLPPQVQHNHLTCHDTLVAVCSVTPRPAGPGCPFLVWLWPEQ